MISINLTLVFSFLESEVIEAFHLKLPLSTQVQDCMFDQGDTFLIPPWFDQEGFKKFLQHGMFERGSSQQLRTLGASYLAKYQPKSKTMMTSFVSLLKLGFERIIIPYSSTPSLPPTPCIPLPFP